MTRNNFFKSLIGLILGGFAFGKSYPVKRFELISEKQPKFPAMLVDEKYAVKTANMGIKVNYFYAQNGIKFYYIENPLFSTIYTEEAWQEPPFFQLMKKIKFKPSKPRVEWTTKSILPEWTNI